MKALDRRRQRSGGTPRSDKCHWEPLPGCRTTSSSPLCIPVCSRSPSTRDTGTIVYETSGPTSANTPIAIAGDAILGPRGGASFTGRRAARHSWWSTRCREPSDHASMSHCGGSDTQGQSARRESLDKSPGRQGSQAGGTCLALRLPLKCHSPKPGARFCIREMAIKVEPLTESNRRPSPYHGPPDGLCERRRGSEQPEHCSR